MCETSACPMKNDTKKKDQNVPFHEGADTQTLDIVWMCLLSFNSWCAQVRTLKVFLVKTTLPLVVKIKVLTKTLWLLNLWCWDQIINAICVSEISLKFQLYLIRMFSVPSWLWFWAEFFHFYSYLVVGVFLTAHFRSDPFHSNWCRLPEKKKKTKLIITAAILFP